MAINFKTLPDKELFYGAKTCQGCAATIVSRLALKVLGEKTILGSTASCFGATTSVFPQSAIFVNNMLSAFPATAATVSGMSVAAEALGWDEDITMLALAGDGGTVDIGLQALSGAAERNDNMIYICYDNEAYMNTGNQRSGVTPFKSWTTTTPTGVCSQGERTKVKKNLFEIMVAHRIPYVATASTSYPKDFMEKVEKAKGIKGCKLIHITAPCPTGWGFDPARSIEIGKLAVESGLWYLAEYENDEFKLNLEPKTFKPVDEYFKAQARFKHLGESDYREIEALRDLEWKRLRKRFL